ncbi:hypothetical protein MRB53_040216 [Persea americana]|nr:hypothetical protein MRB53_040216 [Persea americana]
MASSVSRTGSELGAHETSAARMVQTRGMAAADEGSGKRATLVLGQDDHEHVLDKQCLNARQCGFLRSAEVCLTLRIETRSRICEIKAGDNGRIETRLALRCSDLPGTAQHIDVARRLHGARIRLAAIPSTCNCFNVVLATALCSVQIVRRKVVKCLHRPIQVLVAISSLCDRGYHSPATSVRSSVRHSIWSGVADLHSIAILTGLAEFIPLTTIFNFQLNLLQHTTMIASMATQYVVEQPEDVASRVLRRVQVSKMTRVLQDRLALANVKIQHGWENMSLDIIEPKIEEIRKRPASSNDTISDAASNSSRVYSSRDVSSSPLTAPMFSDDASGAGRELKRIRTRPMSASLSRTRRTQPWKKTHNLPESSPIKRHNRFDSNNAFASETSTIADPSPEHSEDDDADLPIHRYSINTSTKIVSSPPRTPSPARRSRKMQNVSWSRTPKTGEEGADLLIYLATSPAMTAHPKTVQPPSTPPCKSTPLPSSHMTPV